MQHCPPTTADYANSAAQDAKKKNLELERRVSKLEDDLTKLTAVVERLRNMPPVYDGPLT